MVGPHRGLKNGRRASTRRSEGLFSGETVNLSISRNCGESAHFGYDPSRGETLKTMWRWTQSGANRSPTDIPCKQGNLQGNCKICADFAYSIAA